MLSCHAVIKEMAFFTFMSGGGGCWKNLIMLSYEYEVETSVELWTFFLSDIEARTKSEH